MKNSFTKLRASSPGMPSEDRTSLAICTYNRASSLARTLRSLEKQQGLHEVDWELLVVDNNSSDNTRQVVESLSSRLPARYIFEPDQGLSAARNRALREYQGEQLIFTDDDVVLHPRWLSSYVRAFSTFSEAHYFGGRILPLWSGGKPRWLTDPELPLITGLMVQFDLGTDNRWLNASDLTPFGASFAVRRKLTEMLEPFRKDLGVHGNRPGRGEEAEYLGRAQMMGMKGVYVGRAECYHAQDPSRFHPAHLYRYGIEKGRVAALTNTEIEGSWWRQGEFAAKAVFQLLKGRGDRFRQCIINMGIQRGLVVERQRKQIR